METKLLTVIVSILAVLTAIYIPDQVENLISLLENLKSLKLEDSSTALITKGSGTF